MILTTEELRATLFFDFFHPFRKLYINVVYNIESNTDKLGNWSLNELCLLEIDDRF